MLLPYRAKNPPEQFPYVTLGLIGLNTLIFALTVDEKLEVREDILNDFAVSHNTMLHEPWRVLTAMFLHANLWHLLGNMLALWLFGAAVEGRLKPAKYIALYLITGIAGDLLEDVIQGVLNPDIPSLGASGAIMGLSGAYLYLFPFSRICVLYWFGWFWRGIWEIHAYWVVLYYIGFDLLGAFVLKNGDGVGHLAHLGGFGAGLLLVLLFRTRRDSAEVSEVQAIQADVKDYTLLSLSDLETLLQHPTEDLNLVLAYAEKALTRYQGGREGQVLAVLNAYAQRLATQADPERFARILIQIPITAGGIAAVYYLRVGSRLEAIYSNDLAAQIYRRVYDLAPTAPDTEIALFRLAQILERAFQNRAQAQAIYHEMLRLFPRGQMAFQARQALQRL